MDGICLLESILNSLLTHKTLLMAEFSDVKFCLVRFTELFVIGNSVLEILFYNIKPCWWRESTLLVRSFTHCSEETHTIIQIIPF